MPEKEPGLPGVPAGAVVPRVKRVLAVSGVALAALLLYLPTAGFELVWDDHFVVRDAASIGAARGPAGFLFSEYRTEPLPSGYYRPLALLSLGLNGLLPGGAAPLHLVNAALHAAVSALLAAVLLAAGAPLSGAAAAGLLFAVHPAAVEVVAPVAGRVDLLPALFCLLSVWAWLAHRAKGGAWRLALGGAAYLAAILSKESGFILPLALLAWDAAGPGPARPSPAPGGDEGGWWVRNRAWFLTWGAGAAAALALRLAAAGVPLGGAGAPERISPLLLLLFAGKMLALPWPLVSLYTPPLLAVTPWAAAGAGAAAAVFAAGARVVPGRAWLVALAWTGAFLLPFSGVFPLKSAAFAERYLYLPALGFCALVGLTLSRLASRGARWRKGAAALGAAAAVALASLSLARLPVWKDEVALFSDMVRVSPEVSTAHNNLGVALEERGRIEDAILSYRRALEAHPGNDAARGNLARALRKSAAMPNIR